MAINKLLQRQLSRLGLSETNFPTDLNQWQDFINLISKVYHDFDDERYLIERSVALSSKEITELNAELKAAQHIAGLGSWTLNVESGEVRLSQELRSIQGLSSSDPNPNYQQFLKTVHPNDLKLIKSSIELCVATGQKYSIEIRVKNKQGNYRWFHAIGTPLHDGKPPHKFLTGIAKDVTEEHVIRSKLETTQAITTQYLAHIKLAFYQLSEDGNKIMFLNREIETISGKPLKYFVGIAQWLQLVVAEDRARVTQYYLNQAGPNVTKTIEYKIIGNNGLIRNILDKGFIANDTNNKVVGLLGIIQDLTAVNFKRHIEESLNEINDIFRNNDTFKVTINNVLTKVCQSLGWPIGELWLLDETKKQLYLFSAYTASNQNDGKDNLGSITTFPSETKVFEDIFKNHGLSYFRDGNQLWHKNYPLCIAAPLLHKQETLGIVSFFVNREHDFFPEVNEMLINLVNEFSMYLHQEFAKDEYFINSNYDPITGLPNHKFMLQTLKQLIANNKGESIVVIMILIDQIDKINHAYGVDVGNKLLKELTTYFLKDPHPDLLLMSNLEELGFVFLFNNLNNLNAINSIVKLMLNINKETFFIHDNNVSITVSVGVSIFPNDGKNATILLSNAKAAAVNAQKSGGNCVIYATDDFRDELLEKVNIEFALHRALENNEFVLHYQPKVDLKTGIIIGAEALLRWQEPNGKLHMPGYFLDIAESTDLIVPIGEWVLREVCRQISVDSFGVPIAVNLSIRQFKTKDYFFDFVKRVVAEYAVNPRMLEFEVTESIIISGDEIIKDFIKFRNMGINISFDDFGTEYCSFSYLKNYIPDRMKIDKTFVDGVPESPTNMAIIKSLVALGKSLNISLTVEGAERPEQVKFFIDLECDDLQSYYISKAVPAAEFKKLLQKNYKPLFQNLMS